MQARKVKGVRQSVGMYWCDPHNPINIYFGFFSWHYSLTKCSKFINFIFFSQALRIFSNLIFFVLCLEHKFAYFLSQIFFQHGNSIKIKFLSVTVLHLLFLPNFSRLMFIIFAKFIHFAYSLFIIYSKV